MSALLGEDKRRFTIHLPPALAEKIGESTITITEERDGLNGAELAHWLAFYEIERERNK